MNNNLTCVIILGKKDVASLPQSIFDSINACEQDVRRALYSNIVLSGGTSSFDGLPKRLDYEIEELAPHLKKNRDTGKDMVNVMSGKKIFFKPKSWDSFWVGFWDVFFGKNASGFFNFVSNKDHCISYQS